MAYDVNLIENEIRKAVGMDLIELRQTECDGYWCEMVIHARPGQTGKFSKIEIDPEIMKKYIKVIDLSVKEGDLVLPFTGANMALGDMFLRFESREELVEIVKSNYKWLKIILD